MKNPVYIAERRHQKHVLESNRSATLWIWIAILMLIPALLTALGAIILTLLGVEIREIPPETDLHRLAQNVINALLILLIAMNVAQSLVVTLVASGLAAESVRREHRHQTWDLLILTGQPARSIARGKILAAFWTFRRDIGLVTILRLGLVAVVYEMFRQANQLVGLEPIHQEHLLVLFFLTLLWTLIDSFMAVGTAVAAASVLQFRAVAMLVAFVIRIAGLFFGVMWLSLVCNMMAAIPEKSTYAVLGAIGLLVFAIIAYLTVLISEISVRSAGASPHISQFLSQPEAATPSEDEDIPTLSQLVDDETIKASR